MLLKPPGPGAAFERAHAANFMERPGAVLLPTMRQQLWDESRADADGFYRKTQAGFPVGA